VLEQLVFDLAARRGGEVDIPGAVVVVQFRRPNQFAVGAGVRLVPDIDLFASARPAMLAARRSSMRSYCGTEAVK
jgi:hypothetical protein